MNQAPPQISPLRLVLHLTFIDLCVTYIDLPLHVDVSWLSNVVPSFSLCSDHHTTHTHKPLSRHIHHLMFYPGWRNARQRCRTADGAVRRLAPIPPCGAKEVACIVVAAFRKGGRGGLRGRRGPRPSPPLLPPRLPPFWVRVLRTVVSHTVWAGGGDHSAKRTPPGRPGGRQGGGEARVQPVA